MGRAQLEAARELLVEQDTLQGDEGLDERFRLRLLLGGVLERLGDVALGTKVIRGALASRPNDPRGFEAYFTLAIAYGKGGDRVRELAAYDAYLQRASDPDGAHVALSNRGEARMAEGDFEGAVSDFRTALAIGTPTDSSRALTYYNLAVALDLEGDLRGAMMEAGRALVSDPSTKLLDNETRVFFVPDYRRAYYKAFATMAEGAMTTEPESALFWLELSGRYWEQFLARAVADDPWMPIARVHLGRCEREGAKLRAKVDGLERLRKARAAHAASRRIDGGSSAK